MLIMREPLKPKSLSPVKCFLGDAMEKKITANYRQMEAQYTAEELFHIASQPPEIYLQEGGLNASLINQTNIRNQQEVKLELVCNLLNRLAVTEQGEYTYQDRVYIENMLRKLSVRDTKKFMRQVQNFKEDTQNMRSLLQIYQEHFNSLKYAVGSVHPEKGKTGAGYKENREHMQEIKQERYLHQSILERLGTDRMNTLLREVYRPVPAQEEKISQQEIVLAEQRRLATGMELQNTQNRVLGNKVPAHFSRINIYEEGTETTGKVTKQEILSELSEAVLLNLADSLYQTRQESIQSGRDLYLTWSSGFEQIVENTMERFMAGHSEESGTAGSTEALTEYQERINDIRRQEIEQLRQITAELQTTEPDTVKSGEISKAERIYLRSQEGDIEENIDNRNDGKHIAQRSMTAKQGDLPAGEETDDPTRGKDTGTVKIRSLTIDRARAKRDSLRALENPEEVIREYLASTTKLEELEERRDRYIRESMSEETRRMLSRVEELRPGTVPGFRKRDESVLSKHPEEPAETELSHRELVSISEQENEFFEREDDRRETEMLREELLREVFTAADQLMRTKAAETPQDSGIQKPTAAYTESEQNRTERAEAYRQLITLRIRKEEKRLQKTEELHRRIEELSVLWNHTEHIQTDDTVRLQQELSRLENFAESSRQRMREQGNNRKEEITEKESFTVILPSELHIQEEYRRMLWETRQMLQQIGLTQSSKVLRGELLEMIDIWNEESEIEYREWQLLYHNIKDIEQSIQQIRSMSDGQQISDLQQQTYIENLHRTADGIRTWRKYRNENMVSQHSIQPLQILYRELQQVSEEAFGEALYNSKSEQNIQEIPYAQLVRETEYLLEQIRMMAPSAGTEPWNASDIRSTKQEMLNELKVSRLRQREDLMHSLSEISQTSEELLEYARSEIFREKEADSAAELETMQNILQREIEAIQTGIQTEIRSAGGSFTVTSKAEDPLTVIHRQSVEEQNSEEHPVSEEPLEILQREQEEYKRYQTELSEMYSEIQRVKRILPDTPESHERLERITFQIEKTLEEFHRAAETAGQQKEMYRTLQIQKTDNTAIRENTDEQNNAEVLRTLENLRLSQREDLMHSLFEISQNSEELLEYARSEIFREKEADSAAELETVQNILQREIEAIQTGIQTELRSAGGSFTVTSKDEDPLTVIHRQSVEEQNSEEHPVSEEPLEILQREQEEYKRYRTELSEIYSEIQRVKRILPDTPESHERLERVTFQIEKTLEEFRRAAETAGQQKEMYRILQIQNKLSNQSKTGGMEFRSGQQSYEQMLRQYTELTELSKNMLAEETDQAVTVVIREKMQKLEEIQKRFENIASRSVHETEEFFDRQERIFLQEQIENRQEYQNILQEMLIELQKSIAPNVADGQNAGQMSAVPMNHRHPAALDGGAELRSALASALGGGEISVSHFASHGSRMSDRGEKIQYRRTLLRNKLEQTLENIRRENRSWMGLLQAIEYTERALDGDDDSAAVPDSFLKENANRKKFHRTENLRKLIRMLHTWNTRMQHQTLSQSIREPARMLLKRICEVSLPAGEQTSAKVREALSEITNIPIRADQPKQSLEPEVRQNILEYLETARTAEILEQKQIRTYEHRNRQETEQLVQTVHRELLRQDSSPRTGSISALQPFERLNIELVHKQEQQGIDEAVLEDLRIRQRGREMPLQERSEEITNRNVSTAGRINIPIPNMPNREQEQISEVISRSLQGHLNTISDQVYSRLEKRLTSDRKRRGY